MRKIETCRSWLFVEGANSVALARAPASGADVLIQELEDFTPPDLRPQAHALARETYQKWRVAGVGRGAVVGVRINPFSDGGRIDLAAVMPARPDMVALPKVSSAQDIVELDRAISAHERDLNIPIGTTLLVPNIESATALVHLQSIAQASDRVTALMLASEDMAEDLGAERLPDCSELAYVRQRFLVECVAAGVLAVDCPYTWADIDGLEQDAIWARRMGYRAKSAVALDHPARLNQVFTPQPDQIAKARRIIRAFEAARGENAARAELDGALVELPTVKAAHRLLQRLEALREQGEK